MATGRVSHTATLLSDGRVVIACGTAGNALADFDSADLYDPTTGTFSPAGSLATPRPR